MIERYELNKITLPTIPTPHDTVIKRIEKKDEYMVLYFEDYINRRDSVKYQHPNANTLILRFHLLDSDVNMYMWEKRFKREAYVYKDFNKVVDKLNGYLKFEVTYLYHYVAYNSMILILGAPFDIQVHLELDYVEFEWIEENKNQNKKQVE